MLAASSRCTVQTDSIDCTHQISTVTGREVYWQNPLGTPPAQGWPAAIVFQGTGFGPNVTWSGGTGLPFGGFYQIKLQAMLLDNGFTVIAPAANTAWATNFPGYEQSADHALMLALFDAMAAGTTFGPIDMSRVYATGISSGGYMTSRMAVTYPGTCRALAIQSASYATCSGPLCNIPSTLPVDHPPTLFLHGQVDTTVPVATAQAYYDKLKAAGIETEIIIDPNAGHEWLYVAPEEITCWFMTH
jgi:predicted esterase